MSTYQRTQNDVTIMEVITKLRAKHQACTMRAVAATLKLSPTYVTTRLQAMKEAGLVDWTTMPGSLHLVERTNDVLAEVTVGDFTSRAKSGSRRTQS
jgi:RIO-like serine/threonine protein kinase